MSCPVCLKSLIVERDRLGHARVRFAANALQEFQIFNSGIERLLFQLPCGHYAHESCVYLMRVCGLDYRCGECVQDDTMLNDEDMEHGVMLFAQSKFQDCVRACTEILERTPGHKYAAQLLGLLQRFGLGCDVNLVYAAKCFMSGQMDAEPFAKFMLGEMYLLGEGVPQDFHQAVALLRCASESGAGLCPLCRASDHSIADCPLGAGLLLMTGTSTSTKQYIDGCEALARLAHGNVMLQTRLDSLGGKEAILHSFITRKWAYWVEHTRSNQIHGYHPHYSKTYDEWKSIYTNLDALGCELVHLMSSEPYNVEVQRYGCIALGCLAYTCSNVQIRLGDLGCIEVIISAVRNCLESPEVQVSGCCAVKRFARRNNEFQPRIVAMGGMELAFRAMTSYACSTDLQECSCEVIEALAYPFCSSAQLDFEDLWRKCGFQAVELVLTAMKAHAASVGVQTKACRALHRLASMDCNSPKVIEELGGIAAILAGMKAHTSSEPVQESGCAVLTCLVCQFRSSIWMMGGVEAVLLAMRSHAASRKVQQQGCGFLSNLIPRHTARCSCEDCQLVRKLNDSGFVEAILNAMNKHRPSKISYLEGTGPIYLSSVSTLLRLQERAFSDHLGILFNLRAKVLACGGFDLFLSALRCQFNLDCSSHDVFMRELTILLLGLATNEDLLEIAAKYDITGLSPLEIRYKRMPRDVTYYEIQLLERISAQVRWLEPR